MTYSTIRAALDTILDNHATAESVPVAWENRDYKPGNKEAFFSADLLPTATGDVGLSLTSKEDFSGLYQVNVNVPKGSQTAELRTLVDGILTAFKRGTKQGDVLVEGSSAAPALTLNEAWHSVPVTIRYRLFA